MDKRQRRKRRARRTRAKIRELEVTRLCVHRTPRHIYAQIISPQGNHVITSASTLSKDLRAGLKGTGNKARRRGGGQADCRAGPRAGN